MDFLKFLVSTTDAVPQLTAQDVPMPSYEGAFIKMFLTLLALIVGLFVAFWLIKRFSRGKFSQGGGKSITILEKKPLSQKTMLYLIDIDGKQTVIAESQLEVKKILDLDPFSPEKK
jgi:flagellar protein FliO/FliZ